MADNAGYDGDSEKMYGENENGAPRPNSKVVEPPFAGPRASFTEHTSVRSGTAGNSKQVQPPPVPRAGPSAGPLKNMAADPRAG